MKRFRIALLLYALFAALPAGAQVNPVPPLMNFQGRLAKPDGTPVTDGTYAVRFSLWNAASDGTELWNQTVDTVNVKNGVFSALLTVDTSGLFNGDLWLEIKIGEDAPLTPRQRLVSTAYAMKANTVPDGSITGAKIADGTITASKLDAGVFTGANLWSLLGNAGTNPSTNFLGTTDNQPLVFRTNGYERMRLMQSGYLGVGTSAPTYPLTLFTLGGAGMVQTDGNISVGSYVGLGGGWFGTFSNHPLYFFTNNGLASLTVNGYQLISVASDFILKGRGGGVGNNSHAARALVDNGSGGLVLNFANDFGKVVIGSDTTVLGQLTTNTLNLQGADLAEKFDVQAEIAPGMVVEIDPDHEGKLKLASGAYNRRVAGIVSGAGKLPAGVVLSAPNDKASHSTPIAMSGRVWVYTDATTQGVKPGDFLTTAQSVRDTPCRLPICIERRARF